MPRPPISQTILHRLAALCAGLVLLALGGGAVAAPITFTYDPHATRVAFTDAEGFCLGCTPRAVKNPNPISFELDGIGDAFEIPDFLTVFVDGVLGTGFAIGEGSATLEANIAFSAPSAAVSGSAFADGDFSAGFVGSSRFFFSFRYEQDGSIAWRSQPANLVFDDGTEVSLAFADASASCRNFRCFDGLSANVGATTTLARVPEPGTLALTGIGLLGVGAAARRRWRPGRSSVR